jgi:hypothetical protein
MLANGASAPFSLQVFQAFHARSDIMAQMMTPLEKCINNNHALYQAVFGRLGVSFQRNDSIWYALEQTPPLYSNIVTRSPEWRPDEIFHEINARFESEGWDEWSIKDSFGVLDLEPYGFTKLFDAKWMYLEPSKFEPAEEKTGLRYEAVDTVEVFENWLLAWDADKILGKGIFDYELMWDISFIAGYGGEEIVSGCIVNPSDGVRGISNIFAPDNSVKYWSGIIDFLDLFNNDLVGYERDFERLRELGFESPGDLSVWVKIA